MQTLHGGQFEFKAVTRRNETYDWNINACTCWCGRYNIREGVTRRSSRWYIESSIMTSCFADCLKVKCLHVGVWIPLFSFKHGFLVTNMIVFIKVGSIIGEGLSRLTVYWKIFTLVSLLSVWAYLDWRTSELDIVNVRFFFGNHWFQMIITVDRISTALNFRFLFRMDVGVLNESLIVSLNCVSNIRKVLN